MTLKGFPTVHNYRIALRLRMESSDMMIWKNSLQQRGDSNDLLKSLVDYNIVLSS